MIRTTCLFIKVFTLCMLPFVLQAQSHKSLAVLNAEAQRFSAMMQADTAALRPMLADDLIYVHSNALKETKSAHLSAIGSKKLVYKKMDRQDALVRIYKKSALVNGTIHVQGILNGTAFEVQLLYAAWYHQKHKRWQLVHWQSTKVP